MASLFFIFICWLLKNRRTTEFTKVNKQKEHKTETTVTLAVHSQLPSNCVVAL